MASELTTVDILAATVGGNGHAKRSFDTQVTEQLPALFSFAMRLTRSRPDAEDLVQDTVVRAYVGRLTFQAGTNMKSWLFTIMRHARFALFQRESRTGESLSLDGDDFPMELLPSCPCVQELPLMWEDTNRMLDGLPEEQRESVLLVAVGEASVEQAAARMGVEPGTIKSRVNRARARMGEMADGTSMAMRGSAPDHLARHLQPSRRDVIAQTPALDIACLPLRQDNLVIPARVREYA